MQEELTTDFLEPTTLAKVTVSLSPYKVSESIDLLTVLFKAPKVGGRNGQSGRFHQPVAHKSELRKAVEMFYESSMASWVGRVACNLVV